MRDAGATHLLSPASTRVVAGGNGCDKHFGAQIQTDAIGNLGAISWLHLSRLLTAAVDRYCRLLPDFGVAALDVARAYWRYDLGTVERLTTARVACWQYLQDKHGNSTTTADDEDRCLRALICVLCADGGHDPWDTAHWVASMLTGIKSTI